MGDGGKIRVIEHDELVEDVTYSDDDELGTRTNPELAAEDWLSELGGKNTFEIRVYRDSSLETGGKQPFLFSFSPEDYSMGGLLVELRDEYGSGVYWVKGYSEKRRLVFNRRIAVENQKEKKRKVAAESGVPLSDNTDMMKMLAEMQDKNDNKFLMLLTTMSQMNQAPATPAISPTDMMGSMMGMMLQMKEFVGGGNQGANQIELVTQGMELATKFANGDKESNPQDTIMELIKTFGQPIAEAVKNMPAAQPRQIETNPGAQQNAQQTAQQNGQPIQNATPQAKENPSDSFFQTQTNLLLERAKNGSDPVLYADVLLDSIPNLTTLLNNRPIGEVLIGYNPEIANYANWFDDLNSAIYTPYDESIDGDGGDLTKDEQVAQNDGNADSDASVIIDNEKEISA